MNDWWKNAEYVEIDWISWISYIHFEKSGTDNNRELICILYIRVFHFSISRDKNLQIDCLKLVEVKIKNS